MHWRVGLETYARAESRHFEH